MFFLKRLASGGAALVIASTLTVVGVSATPAYANCGTGPNGETSIETSKNLGGNTKLTLDLFYSYVTCLATGKIFNGNAAGLGEAAIRLYRRSGGCKSSNSNGTEIASWSGTVPGNGVASATSSPVNKQACFRLYLLEGGYIYDGISFYVGSA